MSLTKEFEKEVAERLKTVLNRQDVLNPWRALSGKQQIYLPEVDIAAGPFATEEQYIEKYDEMVENNNVIIDIWIRGFIDNRREIIGNQLFKIDDIDNLSFRDFGESALNRNARCFLAIEVENKNSTKHRMGSMVNAGALGRIGLFVAWQDSVLRSALRLREYFSFLQSVGKPTYIMDNVLIITHSQLATSLGINI